MKLNSRICVSVVILLTAIVVWQFSSAFGQQGGRGGGGRGGAGGQGGAMMAGGFGVGPFGSVAANSDFVYVLQNNTLVQFSAQDLTEIKRITLDGDLAAGFEFKGGGAGVGGGRGGFGGGFGFGAGGQGGVGGQGGGGGQGGQGGQGAAGRGGRGDQ